MISQRLKGSVFKREYSGTKEPARVIFLSLEGKKTEVQYFRGLNRALAQGKLPFERCIIKVLKREDNHSDPSNVIALLDEFVYLEKYSKGQISSYFQGNLVEQESRVFEKDALSCGVPVRDLKELFDPETDNDVCGIVIDHDGRSNLPDFIEQCRLCNYNVFLSTPCFELWLLMHFVDIRQKYNSQKLLENKKLSKSHTYVSREFSKVSGQNKRVNFERCIPGLVGAIRQSKHMSDNVYDLLDQPGSNLGTLFEIIENKRNNMWPRDSKAETASALE